MKYQINHTTTYEYHESVATCQNIVHLAPRTVPRQTCQHHRLLVRPTPRSLSRRMDYFGNPVTYFSIDEGHRKLTITSATRVDVRALRLPELGETPPWEAIRDALPLDRGASGEQLSVLFRFAPCGPRSRVGRLCGGIVYGGPPHIGSGCRIDGPHSCGLYLRSPGDDRTHAPFRGVRQSPRRVPGFGPRRDRLSALVGPGGAYTSGYLRTLPPPGKPRLVGADASHAWVGVFCGPLGWIDVDPTNDALVDTHHVTVAWGRDDSDVCPINGVFIGGGAHVMTVSADVEPLDEAE